ncbi:MAG TPA: ABC transporter permease [Cyanobacteria bacterium UBA8803]|nr:ABC transporter permease [Cyanobacteria bacterium UBA9273]HBL62070.1 ABC transporter permease [Cyanobacteria bacterium UBA8803]
MKRILSQCRKELAQFQRDRLTLALAFILPLMTLLIFGFAIRLEAKNIPLFVQDFDLTPLSRSYIERLFATNQFIPVSAPNLPLLPNPLTDKSQLQTPQILIDQGIARAAVVIPPDFSERIKEGKSSTVQVLVDGTDTNNARVIQNIIQATTRNFLRSSGLLPATDRVIARVRIWFNPGRKESLYIVPGLFAVILWIYPSLLTAIAMVREKEKGTILQIYASSLTAAELLVGKGLAYFLIGMSEALLIMGLGSLIWGLRFAGDPTPLLISTPIFLADSVSFGLLIGVRAGNQNAAVTAVAFLGFLTALLLSGFIYPLSNIPFPLSLISNIVPARYYIVIHRDAYVRGTGWPGVWLFVLILILLGVLLFNAARLGLRRMQLSD